MNSKYSVPLILAGLILVATVVLWPRDDKADFTETEGDSVIAAETAEVDAAAGSSTPDSRQRVDPNKAVNAAGASINSNAADAAAVEVQIVIDGQRAGYPLAFSWQTGFMPKQTLLSDAFGRLSIPAGKKNRGELELPEGLDWMQSLSALESEGDYQSGSMNWEPQQPLLTLDLKRQPGWHGRVLKPGALPGDVGVWKAKVSISQKREKNPEQTELRTDWQFRGGRHSSSTNRTVKTGEAGNFFTSRLDGDDGRMIEVHAEVMDSPVKGYAKESWVGEQLPADGWLGEMVLEATESADLAVRVLDPKGQLVLDANVFAQNQRLNEAEADGVYRFANLKEMDVGVSVNASGFLPASIRLNPPFADSVYEVTLQPTTRFICEIDMKQYPFSTTPVLIIRAPGHMDFVDASGKELATVQVTVGSLYSTASTSGKEPGSRLWRGEVRMNKGRMVMSGLRKDVAFQVELAGPFGPLAIAEVPPRENDEHTLKLEIKNSGRRLHGKVLNGEGMPLAGAFVSLSDHDGHRVRRSTGLDGSFEVKGATLEQFSIDASLAGYVRLDRDDLAMPADGNLGEFVLHPARKMRVRFMRPDGASGPVGMSVNWSNEDDRGYGVTREKGYFVVSGLAPHLPIDLDWKYGGVVCTHRINVGEDKVRIPLPAVGELRIELTDSLQSMLGDDCYLSLQIEGSPPPTVAEPNGFCIGMKSSKSFDSVAVGDYRVCMYRLTGRGEERQLEQVGLANRVHVKSASKAEVLLTD
jgi:hypothetical protein